MKLAIVVPVKAQGPAKQRLAPIFDPLERARLARAMAEDVLRIVSQLRRVGRFVVSDDLDVLELARSLGIEPIEDRAMQGQSAAVRQGFAAAWERGFRAALMIPGDVPGVDLVELQELCQFRPELEVVIVPDREGRGTNGLRLLPPHAIALRFGERSLALHHTEAIQNQRSYAIHAVPSLACDLDRPGDVELFLREAPDTATLRMLRAFKAGERVSASGSRRI